MSFKFIFTYLLVTIAFVILVYNSFLKLSSSPGAIDLFTSLGFEPYGRFISGILEFSAALLLLYPKTLKFGAILGTLLMTGVIFVHITKLGIALSGEYKFFIMGASTFCCCVVLCWMHIQKKNH